MWHIVFVYFRLNHRHIEFRYSKHIGHKGAVACGVAVYALAHHTVVGHINDAGHIAQTLGVECVAHFYILPSFGFAVERFKQVTRLPAVEQAVNVGCHSFGEFKLQAVVGCAVCGYVEYQRVGLCNVVVGYNALVEEGIVLKRVGSECVLCRRCVRTDSYE